MDLTIISIVVGLAALALFLFIAARVLRLAFKLLLAGAVIVVLLSAMALGWWQGWFPSASPGKTQQRPATTRAAPSH